MNDRTKRIAVFLAVTFTFSWTIAGVFFGLGGKWGSGPTLLVGAAYMLGPAVGTVVAQQIVTREGYMRIGFTFALNRWMFLGWVLPIVLVALSIAISRAYPGVQIFWDMTPYLDRLAPHLSAKELATARELVQKSPFPPVAVLLIQGLFAGVTLNAIVALAEEIGWRGYFVRQLEDKGFWTASLIIGFVWGVWHAPLVLHGHNYPEHPVAGAAWMVVWCMLASPIAVWLRLKGKTVLAPAVFHGTLNALAGIPLAVLGGGSDLLTGITGIAGFIALAIVNVGIFFSLKK